MFILYLRHSAYWYKTSNTDFKTKQNNPMQIGDYIVSVSHLHEITNRFTKDKHLLTTTDLNSDDKMNFRSAEKLCSPLVTELFENIKTVKEHRYF